MKEFKFEYDEKTHSFDLTHKDILKDLAEEFAKALEIKPYQVAVQVSLDRKVSISKPNPIGEAAVEAAEELKTTIRDEVSKLHDRILKLKKDEDAGSKKAAGEANKDVKATKKSLEKLAGEFGGKIRAAIEAAIKDEAGEKVKGRSASRTTFRGLKLEDCYFDEKADEDEDEAPPQLDKVVKTLAQSGKELASLTEEEKKVRAKLAGEIDKLKDTIDKEQKGGTDFDIREFVKSHPRDVDPLEKAVEKYSEFLDTMQTQLKETDRALNNAKKIADKSDALRKNKDWSKLLDDYKAAYNRVEENVEEKVGILPEVEQLLEDDARGTNAWKSLASQISGMKSEANSAKELEKNGAALEKLLKA